MTVVGSSLHQGSCFSTETFGEDSLHEFAHTGLVNLTHTCHFGLIMLCCFIFYNLPQFLIFKMYSLDDLNVRCKAVAVPTPHCDRDQLWSRAFSRTVLTFLFTLHLRTLGICAHIPLRTSCVHTVLTFLFCARTLLLLLLYVHDMKYAFVL